MECGITGSQQEFVRPIRVLRTSRMIRLLIADRHELVRLGLRAMLTGEPGLSIRGEAGTLAEAVAGARRVRPDLVLLDDHLPDGSGADACQRLLEQHSGIRILMMMGDHSRNFSRDAEKAGAHGIVHKDIGCAELLHAIRLVAGGDSRHVAAEQAPRLRHHKDTRTFRSRLSLLSPQERRILPLIAAGKTNHEIALKLALADRTVKNYIGNMFKKLNVGRRTQAAAIYFQERSSKRAVPIGRGLRSKSAHDVHMHCGW